MSAALAHRLRVRRLELGLSVRDLATTVGCSPGMIQALENGASLANSPLRLVRALRSALGWSWADLEEDTPTAPPGAVATVCAEAVRRGRIRFDDAVAAGLENPADQLSAALHGVGLTPITDAHGTITIEAREDCSPIGPDITHDRIHAGRLLEPEWQVLRGLLGETLDVQRLSHADQRALSTLVRAGIVEHVDGHFVASIEVTTDTVTAQSALVEPPR